MADKYVSEDAAVTALRPGWKIVGREPKIVEVANPALTVPGPDGKTDPTAPPKIPQTIGTILSIEGPNGEPDKMTVGTLQAADFTDPNRQGGPSIAVIEGPAKGPSATTNKPSDPNKWGPVTRPGTSDIVALWDPVNNDYHPIAAPAGGQPSGKFEPAVMTDADGTQHQIGSIDTGDKSFRPTPTPPSPNPSGKYENQYIQNADGTKRLVGMTDTGDKHFIPVSADPTTQKRTIQTPSAVYSVDDNDNIKKLLDIDKSVPLQAVILDGKAFSFDPNEKDPSKRFTPMGADVPPQQLKQGDDTYLRTQNADGSYTYSLPPGVARTPVLNTNTTAKTLDYYDPVTGKLVSSTKNPNYVEPKVDQPQLPGTNTVSKNIYIADPDHPGQLKVVPNVMRVTASAALQALATQLSGHVVEGDISVEEATKLIDAANQSMQTAATAATGTLSAISQGAQAGANLLQQRSQAAQNLVQQGMGPLGQTKHGLLVAPGADFGQNLVQGAAGFATELGGGPEVYQAAANLVRRADPTGAQGQDAASAYATLSQMFQGYRATHGGQPHPAEVQANGGVQGTQGGTAQPLQTNQQAFASPAMPTQSPDVAAGIQAPVAQVPGQNYGAAMAYTGGISPSNAVPGPSFVAPPPSPALPQQTPFVAGGMGTITPQNRNITITVPTG